jgi:KUP system potassium uptake protein
MATNTSDADSASVQADPAATKTGHLALVIGAVGVVYGDIGTSPLYAFRVAATTVAGEGGMVDRASVLGLLSLIIWALLFVVTVKYVIFLLRADNNGEGGTLALMALAQRGSEDPVRLFSCSD